VRSRGAGLAAIAAVPRPALAHARVTVTHIGPPAAAARPVAGRAVHVVRAGLAVVAAEAGVALTVAGALDACRAVPVALARVAAAWAEPAVDAVLAMDTGEVGSTIAGTRLPIAGAGAAVAGALAD